MLLCISGKPTALANKTSKCLLVQECQVMPPCEKWLVVVRITQKLLQSQTWNPALQTAWLCFQALSLLEETHFAVTLSEF